MTFRRIISDQLDCQPGDLLVVEHANPLPLGIQVYRITTDLDAVALVGALFGNHLTGFDLADHPMLLDGLSPERRQIILDAVAATLQQWGTSILDPAAGIANLIRNARTLLPKPRVLGPITNRPAIAIGAGPSTTALIDQLRELSPRFLVVAADAALAGLYAQGVRVHACTPLERLNSTAAKFDRLETEGTIFCGSPFVPPKAVAAFSEHTLWPTADPIHQWFAGETPGFYPGPTSGTNAVAVALAMTSGPVFLVGHDLCGGHMSGAGVSSSLADPHTQTRLGNDGKAHPTKIPWLRAKNELEGMSIGGRLFNAGGHAGHGLVLNGIPCAPLPAQAAMMSASPIQTIMPGADDGARLPAFLERVTCLGEDLREATVRASRATVLEQMSAEALCPERNRDAFIYLMRSIYAQASLERRLGATSESVIALANEGLANAVDTVCEALEQEVARV